jgi:IS30 family transposase
MGKSYTHLSLEERCLLQAQLEMGLSPEQIASTLGAMLDRVRLLHETIYTLHGAVRNAARPTVQPRAHVATPHSQG